MADSLWTLTLSDFRARTASARPTPGGGSVCAVSASLGLGLVIMALEITHKRAHDAALDELIARARCVLAELGEAADEDVRAFDSYMLAHDLPDASEDDKRTRAKALRHSADVATEVPLSGARRAVRALELAVDAAQRTSLHVISDVLAGSELLHAATEGLFATLAMNLKAADDHVRQRAITERQALRARAADALTQVRAKVHERSDAV